MILDFKILITGLTLVNSKIELISLPIISNSPFLEIWPAILTKTSRIGKLVIIFLWIFMETIFSAFYSLIIREKIPLSAPIKKCPSNSIAKCLFSGVSSESTPIRWIVPLGKDLYAFFKT